MTIKQQLLAGTMLVGIAFACVMGAANASDRNIPPASPHVDPEAVVNSMPSATRWMHHLEHELLPFWLMPQALGKVGGYTYGDFPTLRCNDGSLFVKKDGSLANPDAPCLEQVDPVPHIVWHERDFTRAKSRQIYAYGVAFHMTGNTEYLEHAKAGVNYIRTYILDKTNGGAYSYQNLKTGKFEPAVNQRRSQDLAYALSGLGFYYYLTRDQSVLADILAVKEFIWDKYFDKELDLIRWVDERSPDGDMPDQKELVAQLDQVYGYGLWLSPSLPAPEREVWMKDMVHLAHIMIEQFYSPREGLFWGAVTNPGQKQLGTDHTDFGHSVKTMWMIYQIGKWVGDMKLMDWGRTNAARILGRAFDPETGAWGIKRNADDTLVRDREWWALCELDQVAATLALIDPAYGRYLPTTYQDFLTNMVDHQHGGVYHWVDGATLKPNIRFPKQHSWKNALHTFEHALVAYLTTLELQGEDIPLYYAFDLTKVDDSVHPYFYQAKMKSVESVDGGTKVTFTDLR